MTTLAHAVKKLNFIVIDDSSFQRALTAETLRAVGVGRIETAESVAAAADVFKLFSPHVVLCDWVMPDIDGIAFTKMVRRGETGIRKQTPIIMVTSQATVEAVEVARIAGVDEYVIKPFTTGSLVSRIEAVLFRRRAFIDSPVYAGPCRRRKLEVDYEGPRRRLFDEDPSTQDTPEIELQKQLARTRISAAKDITRSLSSGERAKIREIHAIARDALGIAQTMDDKLLKVAAESLLSYIEGVGASALFDSKVVDAHIDAMLQLVNLPNVQADMREQISGALSVMVKKKLSANVR